MHEEIKFAIDEIDAAVYSGDSLAAGSKDRATLVSYAVAWLEELEHKDVVARAYELGQRFSGVSCQEQALRDRLLAVTRQAVQRCGAGRRISIDPVGIGYLAGTIEELYYDGDVDRRMDLQVEWNDPMLRALGRVRVKAFGVEVVYPPANGDHIRRPL